MPHDKQVTRTRILAAVGELLARDGFAALGVNAVAKAAGVDKVLIYRYFGDFDQLLKAYAEENPAQFVPPPLAWPPREKNLTATTVTQELIRHQLEELRRRHITQEMLRAELLGGNSLSKPYSAAREKMVKEYMMRLPFDHERYSEADLGAMFALLHAGITHLVLTAAHLDYYQGIDLKSARGWKRVEKAIDRLVEGYFRRVEEQK